MARANDLPGSAIVTRTRCFILGPAERKWTGSVSLWRVKDEQDVDKKPRIKPRIQNFKSAPLPSAALMYFLFVLHCWPYISRSHLVSNRVTLFRSPLSACLLLSHSSRVVRFADVPGNKASSSESSSATALLEQVGEPRRRRRRQLWRWYLILPRTI